MYTLEETLADQSDLSTLCADRPLITREIFAPNAFYGYDFIYKKYARLPENYPLKVVLPHGVSASIVKIWDEEVKPFLPVIFSFTDEMRDLYVRANRSLGIPKKIVLEATPILYLLELLKGHPQSERKGTIFFPAHSAHFATVKMNFEALAEKLVNLDEQYKPITVCMYWRDFNLGHYIPFQKRDMKIVSAGHIFDPFFLFRFYHLCSMHHYSASNSSGSSLFYSVKSGCSFFYINGIDYSVEPDSREDPEKGILSDNIGITFTPKSLFATPTPCMTKKQLEIIDYYLGAAYFKSPQALRHRLFSAEVRDKCGLTIYKKGDEGGNFAYPAYYYRNKNALTIFTLKTICHKLLKFVKWIYADLFR